MVAISTKGIVATAEANGHVRFYDLQSGELLQQMPQNEQAEAKAFQFSPDGKWLLYHAAGEMQIVDVGAIDERHGANAESYDESNRQSDVIPENKVFMPRINLRCEVYSRGAWHSALVVDNDGDDRWKIHYDDSPDEWDESVSTRRIRARSATE